MRTNVTNAVRVLTTHRLAGSIMVAYLRHEIREVVVWHDPSEGTEFQGAAVSVVLSHHEQPGTLPLLLAGLARSRTRTVLIYDGLAVDPALLDLAAQLRVYGTADVRSGANAIVSQVRAALIGRPSSHDWMHAGWSRAMSAEPSALTPRERDVVQAMFAGAVVASPADVADELGLSVNTVRVHLGNVRRKLSGYYTGNADALKTAVEIRGWLT